MQPEVRRRRLGPRMCVRCAFCSECCSAALLVHRYRCGLVFGPAGGARGDLFARITEVERRWLLTSSVAALSAEDLTVRRGATRPDAPCRAKAIAAHFMIAQLRRVVAGRRRRG